MTITEPDTNGQQPEPEPVEKVSGLSGYAAPSDLRFNPANEVGVTGLRRYGGVIVEEFLPELQGDRGRRVIREMSENDPVITAMLLAVELSLRQVEWNVEPAKDQGEDNPPSTKADKLATHVQECLRDMDDTWPDVISAALEMLPFGWSYCEVTYKRRKGLAGKPSSKHDDGWWGWKCISGRSQESLVEWIFDEDTGDLLGMAQYLMPLASGVAVIPVDKALHFRTSTRHGNPEGRSLLRGAYRPWFFKRRIEEYEAIGIERDLAGLPMAEVPASMLSKTASADDIASLMNIRNTVRLVRRNETDGLVWPVAYDASGNRLFEFKLLSTGGTRQFDTDKIISRYDQRMAMTTLADFILLGHEGVGGGIGVNLAGTKVDLFTAGLEAWLDVITAEFNDRAIPRLLQLNGNIDPSLYPTLTHGEVKSIDLEVLGKFLTAIAGAGATIFPDPVLEADLLRRADLPVPDATSVDETAAEDVPQPPQPPPPPQPALDPTQQQPPQPPQPADGQQASPA